MATFVYIFIIILMLISVPIGYYFGNNSGQGIILYEFPLRYQVDSSEDRIAFGFKTYERNGVLYRLESSVGEEYIEIRLVSIIL